MDFDIDYKRTADGMDIVLLGELHFADAQMFMQKTVEMVEGRGARICLRMKGLRFIDSSGLGAILYVSEALRLRGQRLEIAGADDNIKKLLKSIQNVGTFVIAD